MKKLTAITLTILFALGSFATVFANDYNLDKRPNKVYESVELVSLIMRLADNSWVFSGEFTDYQRSLLPAFEKFAEHPVVEYARYLRSSAGTGFDAPMWLALYIEKVDDQFQLKEDAAFWYQDPRWTSETAKTFIELMNDFYIESNFAVFFEEHITYFEEHTKRLLDELWGKINFDWFYQFGFSPENLRITIYPSGSQGGFGPTVRGISYAVLPITAYYGDWLEFAVHEFVHSFANPIAEAWYEEDEEFRRMSYDSVDLVRMPFYGNSIIMAKEYVTRAYTILYMIENHDANLFQLLLAEIVGGFPYIETVFAMITEHEPFITPDTNLLTLVFGEDLEYTLGEKERVVIQGERLYFQMVDLPDLEELDLDSFEHNNNGNVFGTQKGDVFIMFGEEGQFLNIDLGENPMGVEWGLPEGEFRKYSYFPLDDENTITSILGVEYVLGEIRYYTIRDERVFYFQIMSLINLEIDLENFAHNDNGNAFGTQKGDMVIVTENGRRSLYIDLGPNDEMGEMFELPEGSMRRYHVLPLDLF